MDPPPGARCRERPRDFGRLQLKSVLPRPTDCPSCAAVCAMVTSPTAFMGLGVLLQPKRGFREPTDLGQRDAIGACGATDKHTDAMTKLRGSDVSTPDVQVGEDAFAIHAMTVTR